MSDIKSKIWINKTEWLKLIYPYIVEWATELDYSIPSVSKLAEYQIKFLDCESYKSSYNGAPIQAVGTHYSHIKCIKIAAKRLVYDYTSTLVHEFAHAVQQFSMGKEFDMQYHIETQKAPHSDNKFENEARALQTKIKTWIRRNTLFGTDLLEYDFKFEKRNPHQPKKKPEPMPKKKPTRFHYRSFYDPHYYENPYSKQWWLRR